MRMPLAMHIAHQPYETSRLTQANTIADSSTTVSPSIITSVDSFSRHKEETKCPTNDLTRSPF